MKNNGVTTAAENASQTNNAWSSLSIQHNNDGAIKVMLENFSTFQHDNVMF